MSTDELIQLRFPNVRPKLQSLFPFDPKYDIEVIFNNNKYELQLAYLRLESGLFKNFNSTHSKVVTIDEDFHEDYFEQTIKCFYGGTFRCPRCQIFEAWKIFDYFRIEAFKKQVVRDMKQNFEQYQFFELMAFAFTNSVEEIFARCLSFLDSSNFMQLKRNKQEIIACPLELFRFLINTHNRRAISKRALSFVEVNSLLAEYCQKNQYSDSFHKELKFQLIEKTCLTAEEYRIIFIEGVKSQSATEISVSSYDSKTSVQINQQAESAQVLSTQPITNDQKQDWLEKLKNLKSTFKKNHNDSKIMHSSVDSLSKSLKRKADQSKSTQRTLSRMEMLVRSIQIQINQKRESLLKITERIQKLEGLHSKDKGNNAKPFLHQEQSDVFAESHIIPAFCLSDLINEVHILKKQAHHKAAAASNFEPTASTANFSKKKKTYDEIEKEKQQSEECLYKRCLLFDKEPISVPQRYLNSLAKLIDSDSLPKKRQLNLLFRRTKNEKNNIGDPSVIKNRCSLLILFETSYKKYAGGFISVQIPSFTQAESLCDYQAFIFSLTHNVKMPIMKGEEKSAISLSKHYLLSFGNDLMISNDCMKEESYCEWPGIYEVPKFSKCTSTKDLVGGSGEFNIEQIQIYEVKNEEIQSIL